MSECDFIAGDGDLSEIFILCCNKPMVSNLCANFLAVTRTISTHAWKAKMFRDAQRDRLLVLS